MDPHAARLGVDIGGTFTDVVLDAGGAQYSAKVLTTYTAPENAIIEGMRQVCDQASVNPGEIVQIIHGTTLATNALIERNGAKTALVTTQGFRDVIEMRTESRFEQYDLNLVLPEPLLPRQQRFTVSERIGASGQVLLPLDTREVHALASRIRAGNYASVAVGLLHSYANPDHERRIRDILRVELPDLMISISSDVSPQMREYERFNTVVANAYIKPLMKSYLRRLKGRLAEQGARCPIFLMHSGGGIISLESAAEFPVRLVESDPAGGAVFAAQIAARYGLKKALSFDMGGTTAKICLIKEQTPKTSRVFEVARSYRFKKGSGMPISIPVIDMVEIGAGGGSLAYVDGMKQIRVGPESAASEPGPACYGRGGTRPAVTDADLVLGKLDPENFAGGSIPLDRDNAVAALESELGSKLGIKIERAAYGVAEVVDENMANAARVHAVENGEDLSDYTMIAFGGAAPLHSSRLCEKLGVQRLLIPKGAGVGSAIGFLQAPFSFEASRSVFMKLSDFNADAIRSLLAELKREATTFVEACDDSATILSDYKVYMRYSGQGWEIPITLGEEHAKYPDASDYLHLFQESYSSLFGRTVDGLSVEITAWAVNATTPRKPVDAVKDVEKVKPVTGGSRRMIYDANTESYVQASVVSRESMAVGDAVTGPAVITEKETAIVLGANQRAWLQEDGCIDVRACS